ncbi:MAG: alpha/beta fold hydrolase [Gammaproteobacteria bacterium]|nr:alpha/beta fold hydrolase [Sideroxydans sp.]MBU3903389.1 alpha/beta fold hydrolase [Gammaproteobacteria bacterium]MBU4046571.1 alpha/beta fold hydrolase [Gammaproteobacteria bacterium]
MAVVLKSFDLQGPAGRLEGVAHLPEGELRAIAVVAHPLPTMGGTMENKVAMTLAKTFADMGCASFRFNFRGVGASDGEFTGGDGETEDLIAVVRYAQEQFGGELPLVLSGFSFGGYVAARAAQRLQPRHLILAAPAVGRFAMPAVSADTLVVHGEHDDVVPLADALEWARPQHLPIVVLPAAEHFFHGRLTQLRDIVKKHFSGVEL